jgi:alkanesulfonate monooxygenase SsuD/methylene tetrahydromethanopterin reductase-like flavin-dependent oxidoreductase (luciferase family)
MTNLVLRFDMRNPQPGVPKAELYQAAIEMAVWADEHGFHSVQFSEHHGSPDGYIPSPIVLASAIAARTKRIKIRFGVLLLPLHDPLRLAEDLAILDIVSNGRLTVAFGAGYAPHEFEMFGVDRTQRARLMEEGVEAIKNAWSGQPFTYRGRKARVMPTPVQQPRPPIWLGGSSPAAARRASRIADHFYSAEPGLFEAYSEECRKLGRDPGPWRDIGTGFFVVTGDVDREWERMAPYIAHEVGSYAAWASEGGDGAQNTHPVDLAPLRASGAYPIMNAADGLAYVNARGPHGDVSLHPLISGMPPEIGWEQLRRFEAEILPHVARG